MDKATPNLEKRKEELGVLNGLITYWSFVYSSVFPKELENLVVVSDDKVVFSTTEADILMREKNIQKQDVVDLLKDKFAKDESTVGISVFEKEPLKIIGLNRKYLKWHDDKPNHDSALFTLAHEVGHCVEDKKFVYLSESVADTFAALAHIHRTGDRSYVEKRMLLHSCAATMSPTKDSVMYYTSNGMQAALALSEEINLGDTFIGTFKTYAQRLAIYYSPVDADYIRLAEKFKKALSVGEVARVMFKNKEDEVVYRAGRTYLSYAARKKNKDRFYDGSDFFWNRTNKKIEKTDKELGFIFNAVASKDDKDFKKMVEHVVGLHGEESRKYLNTRRSDYSFVRSSIKIVQGPLFRPKYDF